MEVLYNIGTVLVISEIGVNFDWVGVAVNVSDDVVVIVVVVMIVVVVAEMIDVGGNAVALGVLVAAGAGAAVLAGFAGCGVGDDDFVTVATFAGGAVATAVAAWVGRAAVGALVGSRVAAAVGIAVGGGVETGTAVGNAVGGRVATGAAVGGGGAEVAGAAVGGGGAEVAGFGVLTGCSTPLVTTTCGVFAAMTKDAVNGISLSFINWVASMYK